MHRKTFLLGWFFSFCAAASSFAQETNPIRANLSSSGTQSLTSFPGTNKYLFSPALTADGRYVAFDSGSSDLFTVSNSNYHVYLRDIASGTTELISRTSSGTEVIGFGSQISTDGRFVLFASPQVNPNYGFPSQLYVRDRQTSTTILVSGPPIGGEPNQSWLASAFRIGSMSDSGRFIAFISLAGNLISPNEPTETTADLFVYDKDLNTTSRAAAIDSASLIDDFAISGNGQIVAFSSNDPNLVPGDSNGAQDLFVTDLSAGTTVKAFTHTQGVAVGIRYLSVSTEGRYVAFVTDVTLDARHQVGQSQAYVYDRVSGTTTLVSYGAGGVAPDNFTFDISISGDGQTVAFSSTAFNILPGILGAQVYLRRWQTGETVLLSSGQAGSVGNSASTKVILSKGGDYAAFQSFASNLVANDTNEDGDYFRVNADMCPLDSEKLSAGQCGCGKPDLDANGNGLVDCIENDVQVLTPGTQLTVAPGVKVSGRNLTVTLQRFSGASLKANLLKFFAKAKAKKKLSIQYQITVERVGASRRERIQRVTKKNQETFKKLPPGQYSVTYQVFAVQGTKKVIKTNVSPRATFSIIP